MLNKFGIVIDWSQPELSLVIVYRLKANFRLGQHKCTVIARNKYITLSLYFREQAYIYSQLSVARSKCSLETANIKVGEFPFIY